MTTPPPDPTNPDLLLGLRGYLAVQGLVRDPRDATSSAAPMWIAPRFGTPAPGQTEGLDPVEIGPTLVISAAKTTGIPPARYENFLRMDGVGFVVRSQTAPLAYSFEQQVRAAINDKRGWTMNGVEVNESLLFRDLQPISSDNLGYTFTMEYQFSLWAPFAVAGP